MFIAVLVLLLLFCFWFCVKYIKDSMKQMFICKFTEMKSSHITGLNVLK